MQILRKLAPLLPTHLLGPLGIKKKLGSFWHLFQLKFEEISPKIPRMQILRKLAPLMVRFTVPPVLPVPPGGQKTFGKFLASISAQV